MRWRLTKKAAREYVKGTSHCPYCDGTRTEAAQQCQCDGTTGTMRIDCFDCGATWVEIWRLVGVEEYERPLTDPGKREDIVCLKEGR